MDEIAEMIKHGCDINAGDYDARTPLHLSASENQINVIKYLVNLKVNINPIDRWGNSPLYDAIENNHNEVVEILLKNGAKLFVKDIGGYLCNIA